MVRTRSYSLRVGLASGVNAYRYALAQYVWVPAGQMPAHWQLPASAVGGVDLRPLSAQALQGGTPQGYAFATALQSPGGIALASSFHMNETSTTTQMRDAWLAGMGYRPAGSTLTDLLWDQLTTGSDPEGGSGPKPLMPGTDNVLRLFVPGHSEVKREGFEWGTHPHTNRVRDVIRGDFSRMWEETNGGDHPRKVLDFWREKYKADWREFVPPNLRAHVAGPLPHETTITESFNKADSATLGPDLTWNEVLGGWNVVSNRAVCMSNTEPWNLARAEHDLSSDDHYAQATIHLANGYPGPCVRVGSGATFYQTSTDGNNWIFKLVSGSQTNLGSTTSAYNAGDLYKVQADGSTISSYVNGAAKNSFTDTSITGNLRCGMTSTSGGAGVLDEFEAADVGGGGGGTAVPVFYHHLVTQGMA
jgi:hypothetical protein